MIGIIGAMESEILGLINNIENIKKETVSGIDFYSGSIGNKKVVVAKSGIGKIFASICAEIMILKYHLDELIHIGIAGALSDDLNLKDIVISSAVIQHDLNSMLTEHKYGYIQDLDMTEIPCNKKIIEKITICANNLNVKYRVGFIASGDQFIDDSSVKEKIKNNFNAIAVDMESASTGLVCYINKVKFCAVRAISDKSNDRQNRYYSDSKQVASDVTTRIILEYLKI